MVTSDNTHPKICRYFPSQKQSNSVQETCHFSLFLGFFFSTKTKMVSHHLVKKRLFYDFNRPSELGFLIWCCYVNGIIMFMFTFLKMLKHKNIRVTAFTRDLIAVPTSGSRRDACSVWEDTEYTQDRLQFHHTTNTFILTPTGYIQLSFHASPACLWTVGGRRSTGGTGSTATIKATMWTFKTRLSNSQYTIFVYLARFRLDKWLQGNVILVTLCSDWIYIHQSGDTSGKYYSCNSVLKILMFLV